MKTDVIMPALGVAQETGKLVSWRKHEGEAITKGEALMEIETDKVTVSIEAPASGVLAMVTAKPGDEVPVGQVVAVIQAAGEASAASTTISAATNGSAISAAGTGVAAVRGSATPVAARLAAEHDLDLRLVAPSGDRIRKDDVLAHMAARQATPPPRDGGRLPASPKARRLAAERGLDLAALQGSGPGGAVLAGDVLLAALPAAQAITAPETGAANGVPAVPAHAPSSDGDSAAGLVELSGLGRLMARRTTESFRDTPHFYLTRELMAGSLLAARERLLPLIEARAGVRLSFTDLLIRVLAQALAEHPMLNASWQDGAIKLHPHVNLGVAAATPQGLLVPVIHDAVGKNLTRIARERTDLAGRAVSGRLAPDDLAGGTATLSNLGMYDVDMFQAIINPPQSMILAVGRVAERPVARNGAIVAAHTFWVTASFDHRIHDGARAAEFLRTFASYAEEPLGLL